MYKHLHVILASIFLFTLITALLFPGRAMGWCANEGIIEDREQTDPEFKELRRELNEEFESIHDDIERLKNLRQSKTDGPEYIIPVVVHVIHDEGDGNISDEQVLSAIEHTNLDLRLRNADTSNIISQFRDRAADTRIELRLAQKDPSGNDFDGINRINSEYANDAGFQGENVFALEKWDRESYFNVYVVNTFGSGPGEFIAGIGVLPQLSEPGWDGVVIRNDQFGTIGTAAQNGNRTFTHEVGHYLGLLHTFQGGCPDPEDGCHESSDRVCDTPPASDPHQACVTSQESCGSQDNIQNHMDYSSCRHMFTEGQRDRMEFFLAFSNSVPIRHSLHTNQNLEETGVRKPLADFSLNQSSVCKNQNIELTNETSHISDVETDFHWEFDGANPDQSQEADPSISFNETGSFSIKLIATNQYGSDTIIKDDFVRVFPDEGEKAAPYDENFSNATSFEQGNWIFNEVSGYKWKREELSSPEGNAALFFNNYENTVNNEAFFFEIPGVNMANKENTIMTFDLAYATQQFSNDGLTVRVSDDCRNNWKTVAQYSANEMETAPETTDPFVPGQNDWQTFQVDLQDFDREENLWIRFEYRPRNGGNNIYVDAVSIDGDDPNSLAAFDQNKNKPDLFSIYPNPSAQTFNLDFVTETSGDVVIAVRDIAGRKIYEEQVVPTEQPLQLQPYELNMVHHGWYFMEVKMNGKKQIKKIGYHP